MTSIWDAPPLITCARFRVDGQLVLDLVLGAGTIVIPEEVRQETVDAGLAGGYPDAVAIRERVAAGGVVVRRTSRLAEPLEQVLDAYRLHEGDKAVVRLSLQAPDADAVVTDDRLLFAVLHRCGCRALFLPDLVEAVVAQGAFGAGTGGRILRAIRPRLPAGFVEHSLRRLEGVI
ncbi:MAG: hypothetical protein HY320_14950 [Armatimonadetes bacterium]|nr:hypothetical protein [Armatimonadota bacterium]